MAYEKTEWKSGDTITAEKLNHMEDGIESGGNGPLVVHAISEGVVVTFDKTWLEIYNAFIAGKNIIFDWSDDYGIRVGYVTNVASVKSNESQYTVYVSDNGNFTSFFTDSENGYPENSFD